MQKTMLALLMAGLGLSNLALAAPAAKKGAPTVAEAERFVADAEARLKNWNSTPPAPTGSTRPTSRTTPKRSPPRLG
ncbi:hypothetical protein LP420_05945 [Massilia sp. B-10]|nr:hypothetical protein LP420_05945 [Massilia sp. B-10]